MARAKRRAATLAVVAGLMAVTAACGGSDDDASSENEDNTSTETTEGGGDDAEGGEDSEGEGGSATADLPPGEIAQAAGEALIEAEALRIATVGDPAELGMGIDLQLDREGTCVGSVTMPGMGSVELLMQGEQVWMKPDAEFWQTGLGAADPAVISLVDGSYLHGSTSDAELAQMAGTCNLDAFTGELGSPGDAGDNMTAGEITDHNGVPVIPLTEGTGAQATEIYVAAEGEPYPVLLRSEAEGMEIEFSNFDEPVPFEEPPADQVLNIADFREGNIGV
ncbi:hypothetical protein [Streptomyces marincola]|uniref:hypothetical protein n=1 Tax=Streptomyces marincola TaxID=2878388 RepID=UPI001CF5EECA|nr:hypothetical protein [Streptomyces marincola]UCM88655.1 hypothetical protein LC193_12205 [Streptomyces marincola]